MKKSKHLFLMAVFILAVSAYAQNNRGISLQTASKGQRSALVIGNSAYTTAPLKNPVNDARAMAQLLRSLDFDVAYYENQSQNDMKRSIRAFGEQTKNSRIRLFYYAGHGIQVNGENYLIPVDADFDEEQEVEYETINVGFVLAQLREGQDNLNIVILDACRNNPFARSFRSATRGLASINAPSGTLIAYATAPGSVAADGEGTNGVYTGELLRYMRVPSMSIEEVFKQVRISVRSKTQGKQIPWEASSLIGDFSFFPSEQKTLPNHEDKGLRVISGNFERLYRRSMSYDDGRKGWAWYRFFENGVVIASVSGVDVDIDTTYTCLSKKRPSWCTNSFSVINEHTYTVDGQRVYVHYPSMTTIGILGTNNLTFEYNIKNKPVIVSYVLIKPN